MGGDGSVIGERDESILVRGAGVRGRMAPKRCIRGLGGSVEFIRAEYRTLRTILSVVDGGNVTSAHDETVCGG